VITDYRIKHYDSLPDLEGRIKNHLLPFFGGRRASNVTTADIQEFVAKRQSAEAHNATINRELAALKRAYALAVRAGKLLNRPYIPMLQEDNVRTGFFERKQFECVRKRLPEHLQAVVQFCYITGWRCNSEVLPLQWRQVNFKAGMVRLEPGMTKNKEGRAFPFTNELRVLLEDQRRKADVLQREKGEIIPWVFPLPKDFRNHRAGSAIEDFRWHWKKACRAAGLPGRLVHDFRRTAVRNLERAEVPRSVAMKMTGHKTESVYRRYAIVSEGDLKEAAARLNELSGAAGTITGTVAHENVQSQNLVNGRSLSE
jgi:integrase